MNDRDKIVSPLRIFVNRTDAYAKGFANEGRAAYSKVVGTVTDELLARHLRGELTLGMYCLDTDDNVRRCCFDFDENTEEDGKQAMKLYNYLRGQGHNPLLESSGGGLYKTHVWVFCEPTPAKKIRAWMQEVCRETGVKPHECFPKQDTIAKGAYGNLVKLPLGKHPFTGNWCRIYDSEKKQWSRDVELLKRWAV